jgi:hypothetical protein
VLWQIHAPAPPPPLHCHALRQRACSSTGATFALPKQERRASTPSSCHRCTSNFPVLSSSRFLPNSSPSTHHNTAALRHPEQRCLVPTSFLFIQIAARPMNAPAAPSCYRARGMQDNAADVLPQRVERSYAIAIALATCRPGSEVGVGVGSDMC